MKFWFVAVLSITVALPIVKCWLTGQRQYQPRMNLAMNSLADRVMSAVSTKFASQKNDINRVLKCWTDFTANKKLNRYVDEPTNKVLQTADCFVEGLTAQSFHDVNLFPWATAMESHYKEILDELTAYEYKRRAKDISSEIGLQLEPTGVGLQGDGQWLGPRDTSGSHYGPEWKTLGIQDRSVWDSDLIHEFPRTVNIMTRLDVPSCEVFFAKQGPRSGLKPHSDKNNFIMTFHLGLDVPEGECWITCGDSKHYWKNGKTCIFDTSIIHSTENQSDRTRYVLLVRFWHPELTKVEIDAFKFIFAYLDASAGGEEELERFEMQQLLMGKDQHKGLQRTLERAGVPIQGMFSGVQAGGMGVETAKKRPGKGKRELEEAKASKPKPKGFGSK